MKKKATKICVSLLAVSFLLMPSLVSGYADSSYVRTVNSSGNNVNQIDKIVMFGSGEDSSLPW
ncbi:MULTISPECIES: hypothetical protein [Paenibacillus]|uniref:Uncharacterized protein n=1 Tax=Paenibacillus alvei TaxID=44250 RepID=A0ABT4EHE2_PAEAL|nr:MULTISPECIES: hypothetical protein [Paenibacillus]MCY9533167.1 hypothetical protein [Paenibacillus alvei]SDF94694.1 hypothetical protein SAMN04488689_108114 [Paenibacillus sp. cl6col]